MLPEKKILVLVSAILIILNTNFYLDEAWASDFFDVTQEHQEKEVTIKTPVLAAEAKEYLPNKEYTDQNGKEYWLKSWRMEPYQIPEHKEWAERTVHYEKVEWEGQIPKQVPVMIMDEVTGEKLKKKCPMIKIKQEEDCWIPDFSFTAVFHSYEADYYQIGEKRIPFNSRKPELKECSQELLKEIGVEAENYRITDAVWNGDSYVDETGNLCRDALVTGEKKVFDCYVTYGGDVIFPKSQGYQCVAVYKGFQSVTDGWLQAHEHQMDLGQSDDHESKKGGSWIIFHKSVVVTLSLLFVGCVIGLLFYIIRRFRQRIQRKEREYEESQRQE
ncbi:hypothetical protein [Lacrimispora sp.]|uniref:hypothetical protein n=1 Tax=Lacrimispora sp. TaxID=2719234 RepID=UPI003993088B